MDKDFKFIQELKTAMIYKKSFGREASALAMPGSFESRARSKSQSRERSLSGGKRRSTSRGSKGGKGKNKAMRSTSANLDASPMKDAGNEREKILKQLNESRGRQMNKDEEEKKA